VAALDREVKSGARGVSTSGPCGGRPGAGAPGRPGARPGEGDARPYVARTRLEATAPCRRSASRRRGRRADRDEQDEHGMSKRHRGRYGQGRKMDASPYTDALYHRCDLGCEGKDCSDAISEARIRAWQHRIDHERKSGHRRGRSSPASSLVGGNRHAETRRHLFETLMGPEVRSLTLSLSGKRNL
jgi:hypothetical protein